MSKRYKTFVEAGDKSIPKYTAYRYRHVISPSANPVEVSNTAFESNQQNVENVFPNNDDLLEMSVANDQISASMEFENDVAEHLHEILVKDQVHNFSRPSQNFGSFEEMINSSDFFKPVSVSINKSKGELILMILKYCIVNSISLTGMANLFKLMNTVFEETILPDSRYLVDKLLNNMDTVEFHATCPNCSAYIGKFDEIEHINKCRICATELDLKNPSNTSFFIILDPSSQIKDMVSMHQDHFEYVLKKRVHKTNHLNDVYDGKEYRKFVNSLSQQERLNYISVVFNTDGACKFKCSQYSIWPLYLIINELPKQERMNKLITCGLWFNKQKPDMSIFLGSFVDMINRLRKDGIPCILRGEERVLKLHIVSCCVDSVARAPIQGINNLTGNTVAIGASIPARGSRML